jgi:uncharacterized OB-fold protein
MAMEYKKPIPVPSDESRPYWEALRDRRLMMPRCDDCGHSWFPPSFLCPKCNASKWTWTQVTGKGRIFSYVVYHRVYHPAFANEVPYAVAVIELDEGPRVYSNVIGMSPDKLACDMKVEVVYEPINDEITLAKFKPVAA